MKRPQRPPLERQMRRVRRRLFIRNLIAALCCCWAAALVLSALWFVANIYWWRSLPGVRLPVAGAILGVATAIAAVLAVRWRTPPVTAALLMDERFRLQERITTSLTLPTHLRTTPAAQALLEDVNRRVDKLDVPSAFPVRLSARTLLLTAMAAAAAAIAFYLPPPAGQAVTKRAADPAVSPEHSKEIEQKIAQLTRKKPEKHMVSRPQSEELKRIEAELERIANKPRSTQDQLKDRIKEMTDLEDRLKNRENELAQRSKSLKQQLQQLDRQTNNQDNQGPAKEFENALAQGDLNKAKQEMDRLAKNLKENALSRTQREQLKNELKKLQEKLNQMAKQEDKAKELNRLHKEGKLDDEALKRELARLQEEADKLKNLQSLAQQLSQAQQSMESGDNDSAGKALSDAADQLGKMNGDSDELSDLRDELQRLQDAKDSC